MSEPDIEKICRLCCEKRGRLISLFEQQPDKYGRSLPDIICDISRLQVERDDGLPQKICRPCTNTLMKMYETIESYRTNDLNLRKQLSRMPLVEIKEEEVEVDLLENAFTQELHVGNISVKQEMVDGECPSDTEIDQSNEEELKEEKRLDQGAFEEDNEEKPAKDDDEEWKPTEESKEAETSPVKQSRKRKAKKNKDGTPKTPGKPGRKRVRPMYPDRPRLHDHKCYICNSDSHGTPEALLAHLNGSHLDMLPYTCPECVTETVVLKRIQGVNYHIRQHANPVKCPDCERCYSSEQSLQQHVQRHHMGESAPAPTPCEQCGKVCTSKVALKSHMKLHTSATACEICGRVFAERNRLRRHIQRRHEQLKLFECHICKKKLKSLCSVQVHIKTYHTNQEFKCSYCSKISLSEATHKVHELKHVENPNYVPTRDWREHYVCVDDGGEGKFKDRLKKCNLCGLVTRNILSHLQTAHFPTEFKCEICGTKFKRKTSYNYHMMEHENGKANYQCPICNRGFTDRKNLFAHLRTKQHRDHPVAQSMLSSLGNQKGGRPKKSSEVGEDASDPEEVPDVVAGVGSYM